MATSGEGAGHYLPPPHPGLTVESKASAHRSLLARPQRVSAAELSVLLVA